MVSAWSATLYVAADPARSTLILDAAPTSMRVREGTGGVKVLSARDKSNIQEAIANTVTKQLPVSFGSTSVSESADGSQLSVQGELELAGSKHPVDFTLAKQSDGKVTGSVVLKQTDWNIKPYSAFRDTFRVQNDVEVGIEISVDGLIGK